MVHQRGQDGCRRRERAARGRHTGAECQPAKGDGHLFFIEARCQHGNDRGAPGVGGTDEGVDAGRGRDDRSLPAWGAEQGFQALDGHARVDGGFFEELAEGERGKAGGLVGDGDPGAMARRFFQGCGVLGRTVRFWRG